MEKRGIIMLVLAAVVFGGSVLYFATTTPGLAENVQSAVSQALSFAHIKRTPTGTKKPPAASSGEGQGSGSIATLLASGGYRTCVVTTTLNGSNASGNVYISKNTFRADFTSVVQGNPIGVSVINDGDTVFVWTTGSTQGIRLPTGTSATTTSASAKYGGVDLQTPLTYTCEFGTPDPALFVPPHSVTFTSISVPH